MTRHPLLLAALLLGLTILAPLASHAVALPPQASLVAPVAEIDYAPEESWYRPPERPWYLKILPKSGFLRLMVLGAVVVGVKTLLSASNKSKRQSPRTGPLPTPGSSTPLSAGTTNAPLPAPSPPPALSSAPAPMVSPAPPIAGSKPTWLYYADEREIGPFDDAALQQLRRAGLLNASNPIRRADGGNWITYADVFGDT